MTLLEYMQLVRDDLNGGHAVPAELGYTPCDKDMGYRSGLRYLGLQQTQETDEIADMMIYQRSTTKKLQQLSLFA